LNFSPLNLIQEVKKSNSGGTMRDQGLNHGPVVKLRKVVRCGKTFYIALPPEFVKLHGIRKGERLPVLANRVMVKVIPMKEE